MWLAGLAKFASSSVFARREWSFLFSAIVIIATALAFASDNPAGAMGGDNPAAVVLRQYSQSTEAQQPQSVQATLPIFRHRRHKFDDEESNRRGPEHRKASRAGYAVCVRLC